MVVLFRKLEYKYIFLVVCVCVRVCDDHVSEFGTCEAFLEYMFLYQ